MSGKRRNALWILINSQNSNRFGRREGSIFNISIYSPSRMTVNPYTIFSGGSPESTHRLSSHKIKPGQSPSLLLTIQDLTKGTSPQIPVAQQTLPSSPLHTPNTEKNCRTLPAELDVTFSAFSVFAGCFPTQLTHQVDISKRKKNKPSWLKYSK